MEQKKEKAALGRRDFLKVATVGAAVGVISVASKDVNAGDVTPTNKDQAGYRETNHIAKYYELANI